MNGAAHVLYALAALLIFSLMSAAARWIRRREKERFYDWLALFVWWQHSGAPPLVAGRPGSIYYLVRRWRELAPDWLFLWHEARAGYLHGRGRLAAVCDLGRRASGLHADLAYYQMAEHKVRRVTCLPGLLEAGRAGRRRPGGTAMSKTIGLLAALALLVAACGDGGDDPSGDRAEVCRQGEARALAHARADAGHGAYAGRCWVGEQAFGPGYIATVEIHRVRVSPSHGDLVPAVGVQGEARCRVRVDLVLGEVEMLDCYRPQS